MADLFTNAELAAAAGVTVAAADYQSAHAYVLDEMTRELGYSPVTVTVTDAVVQVGSAGLWLAPYARDLTALTVDGVTVDVAGVHASRYGLVTGYRWPAHGTVTVSYTHGLPTTPPGAKRAGLALAVDFLATAAPSASASAGRIDPRATRVETVDGILDLRGPGFGTWGVPIADDWVARNRLTPVG